MAASPDDDERGRARPTSSRRRDERDRRFQAQDAGGRPPKGRTEPRPVAGPRQWGGVARKGAGRLGDDGPARASEEFRRAAPPPWVKERVERVDPPPARRDPTKVRGAAAGAVARGGTRPIDPERGKARSLPEEARAELVREAGTSSAPKLAERLADATRAFERERYGDARRMLTQLSERAPSSAAVRELLGLTLYRMGKWRDAARELESFRILTGSVDQHPVLADCYRALKRFDEVDALWRELREVSPSAELVAEGRIVAAGSFADNGDLAGAIALIEPAVKSVRRPQEHHLRLLYVLADLQERAGDAPRARMLFGRLAATSPGFADVDARLDALR